MNNIIAVMPCYKSSEIAPSIAQDVIKFVDKLICVDDCCPEFTAKKISQLIKSEKIDIIFHDSNKGIGGAMKSGFIYALKFKPKIIIKIDSDGQMNPCLIPKLIDPLLKGSSELTKGNRFTSPKSIRKMPPIRIIGNIGLGFITKLSTGYWELFDPTNGFIALRSEVLKEISLEKVDNGYFFETDLLFRCSLSNIFISEIAMEAVYENEKSNLNPLKEFFRFFYKHINIFIKRLTYQYFLLDFNPGSLSLCLAFLLGIFSLFIGIRSFTFYRQLNLETPLGIQILFLATSLICNQFILSFIYYDVSQKPLLRRLKNFRDIVK